MPMPGDVLSLVPAIGVIVAIIVVVRYFLDHQRAESKSHREALADLIRHVEGMDAGHQAAITISNELTRATIRELAALTQQLQALAARLDSGQSKADDLATDVASMARRLEDVMEHLEQISQRLPVRRT